MADETPPHPPSPLPGLLEPPAYFDFPVQLLEQWLAIPGNERLVIPLTRQDLDHLILGLLRNHDAIAYIDTMLVHWSQGKVDAANLALSEFRRTNIESANHIRQFFTAMMVSGLQERSRGK